MEQTEKILQQINLLSRGELDHVLDVDLMLDQTRQLYTALLQRRHELMSEQESANRKEDASEETIFQASPQSEMQEKQEPKREAFVMPVAATQPDQPASNIALEITNPAVNYHNAHDHDIRDLIGINDKYLFISELFHNDKNAYEETVTELNSFETEEEALEWLNVAVAEVFGWAEDSDAVQTFYKLLNDFFSLR